jgi:hypothetical protein
MKYYIAITLMITLSIAAFVFLSDDSLQKKLSAYIERYNIPISEEPAAVEEESSRHSYVFIELPDEMTDSEGNPIDMESIKRVYEEMKEKALKGEMYQP